MRKLLCAVASVCLSMSGWAQTATVTGKVVDPSNAGQTVNTVVLFTLKGCAGNQPRYNGTALLWPVVKKMWTGSSGNISGTLLRNDYITCGSATDSSFWEMKAGQNGELSPPCHVRITTSSFDATQPNCLNQNPTITAPTDTSLYAMVNASNLPFTGTVVAPRIGVGVTPVSSDYVLDVSNPGLGRTHVRIGPSGVDTGGYITSTAGNNITITSGSAFNGTGWVAKTADNAQVHIGNNQIEFHTDSGLTPGNTFSPTIRMHISGSQVTFRAGSAAVPSISNYEQEPNAVDGFWFPTNQVGVSIGGTGRASFSSTALAPITNVGYSLGTSSLSYLNGYFRNVLARNAADTANVVLVQKNSSDDDVFVGNGNARDLYLVAGSGRKVYLSNTLESTASGQFTKLNTASNCSSSASPATCSSASAGSVVVAAAATTVVVNTTAVTANSQIILTRDNSLGAKLSVTCNTQSSLTLGAPYVSARSAGTSFTITLDVAPTTNPMCITYQVLN